MTVTLVSSAQRYTATAAASGDDHLVTIAAGTTANWVAGDYALRAQVALARGQQCQVLPPADPRRFRAWY
jgi:hypothetical protein